MTYDILEHTHRYAVWTAARAVQRGFKGATHKLIAKVIASAKLQERLLDLDKSELDQEKFDRFHEEVSGDLIEAFRQIGGEHLSYGRAAKIIAIYIKTAYVLPSPDSQISRFAHPPVDRILLERLKAKHQDKKGELSYKWTELEKEDYSKLIEVLKELNKEKPFWMIEEFWKADGEK